MGPFTLLCSDLDGTLLNNKRHISAYSREIILRATREGAVFCLASGRPPAMMWAFHSFLELNTPMVCNNGAIVWNPITKQVLSRTPLPATPALEFLFFCQKNGLDWAIFTSSAIYFQDSPDRLARYGEYNQYAMALGVPPVDIYSVSTLNEAARVLERDGLRISVLFHSGQEGAMLSDYFSHRPELMVIHSTPESYDILAPGVSKWTGIQTVYKHYGITPERICVFGNDLNDMDMVEKAKTAFVVANAEPPLLKKASHLTQSNQDDGVARAIEYHVLGHIMPPPVK